MEKTCEFCKETYIDDGAIIHDCKEGYQWRLANLQRLVHHVAIAKRGLDEIHPHDTKYVPALKKLLDEIETMTLGVGGSASAKLFVQRHDLACAVADALIDRCLEAQHHLGKVDAAFTDYVKFVTQNDLLVHKQPTAKQIALGRLSRGDKSVLVSNP